ncbi:MAG: hypothetical protein E7375_00710 [Clostridiales bacterium]|nr:hypothetical protein [Clostridiales bacterium]
MKTEIRQLAEKVRRENREVITIAPENVKRDRIIDIQPILEAGLGDNVRILDNGEIVRSR